MAKFIIDIASPNVRNEYIVYLTYDGLEAKRVSDLTPYTAPDLEQVRKEGYEKGWKEAEDHYFDGYSNGYDAGLDDAWKAARKIWKYDPTTLKEIFGEEVMRMDWFMKVTASEVIEKIFAYEQAQKELEQEQEEIKVGDEVAFHHDDGRPDTVVVITYIGQDGFIDGMDGRGTQYAHKNPKKWTKTGRHFPEIATILEKMRGEQDGKRREE